MGGAQAGEVASKAAAESFDRDLPAMPPERLLATTIEEANRTIHELARKDPGLAGMGTTTTAAIFDPEAEEVAIGHVGDSRAYRFRAGKLEHLTRDHSLVEEMRRKGQLTDAQAEEHPQRSIITRALGPEPEVQVDVQTVPAQRRRRLPDLLRRLDDDARRGARSPASSSAPPRSSCGSCAGRRSQPSRRPRQHHRGRLPRRGRRGAVAATAATPADGSEGATLIGDSAEEAGLTATEVRRRAAAAAAAKRREELETKPRRRRLRTAAKVLAGLLVIAAIVFGAWYGIRQVWFLGTDDAGRVALYRGVPYELPLGIKLYSEHYASPIQTESLPAKRQDAVTGHDLRSRSDAVSLLEEIEQSQGLP